MKLNTTWSVVLTLIFSVVYGIFVVNFDVTVENYSDIIVATTFFFTLFTGFFITRQNDRYSSVSDLIASTDGSFSYIYRVTASVPRIQNEVREIIRSHYTKIVESQNWAYHIVNPSNTLTRLTESISSITEKENEHPAAGASWGFLFEVISSLQGTRKKTFSILNERLALLHWAIVYILGFLLVVSFALVPSGSMLMDGLKILFGASVFISVILLIQLDHLTIFGDHIAESTAQDIFNILDEKDAQLLK